MPTVKVEKVTPEKAEKWLSKNVHNRKVRQNRVNLFARAMRQGDWEFNGDTIRFDTDKNLIDGQHRLLAIIESGIPQEFVIVNGLRPTLAQETVDIGANRSLADMLRLRGETGTSILATTLRLSAQYAATGGFTDNAKNTRMTPQECLRWFEANPNIRDYPLPASYIAKEGVHLSPGLMATLWYVFDGINSDDAEVFFTRLRYGSDIVGDPVVGLRSWIHRVSERNDGATVRIRFRQQGANIIKAWNNMREGEMGFKSVNLVGAKAEPFPEPV